MAGTRAPWFVSALVLSRFLGSVRVNRVLDLEEDSSLGGGESGRSHPRFPALLERG